MVHRGIATIAAALMLCFLLLSSAEPQFFLLHLYQSLIYLAIILMLFYLEDRYAYMIGILTPAVWLLLSYGTGVLGGAWRQVGRLVHRMEPTSEVGLLAGATAILSVVMIVVCGYRWKREFAGLGKFRNTFLVSLAIVIAYFAILIGWFWGMIPSSAPPG